jgi:hypothetical protein
MFVWSILDNNKDAYSAILSSFTLAKKAFARFIWDYCNELMQTFELSHNITRQLKNSILLCHLAHTPYLPYMITDGCHGFLGAFQKRNHGQGFLTAVNNLIVSSFTLFLFFLD